tara:strand:- start:183 stop:401 length:219 start_codon:yes stop_codon:yes gene_type:complete
MTKKRFVLSRALLGQEVIIEFTNKKGITYKYDHDQVYAVNQQRIEEMECWHKYGNYTNSNNLPTWARECTVE